MYKLFIPVKHKTNIKGFWQDDKGKVYIDNILIKKHNTIDKDKAQLFGQGEKAIFYIHKGKAIIEDIKGNIIILKYCIKYKESPISKGYIKALLNQHEGLTIYREGASYTIEIWKG